MTQVAPGSPRALREANVGRVREAVRRQPGATHAQIARATGLSAASVTSIVRELEAAGTVLVADGVVAGRRCRVVRPAPRAGLVAAIDIGRSHVSACLASVQREVLIEHHAHLEPGATATEGVTRSQQILKQLLSEVGMQREQVLGAVVGVPGPLEAATGQIGAGTLLPRWTGTDLGAAFTEALGVPVTVENDANLGALGEYAWEMPAADQPGDLVYVRLTTGIGAGLVVDGRIHRGASGTAGELGHISIDERGPVCRCGNRGCLETYASVPAMLAQLTPFLGPDAGVAEWVAAVSAGDPACCRMVEEMGRYVGVGIATLLNLLNPALVVLGGPIVAVGEELLQPIREVVRRRAIPAAAATVHVRAARFTPRSELYGAITLAAQMAEHSPSAV